LNEEMKNIKKFFSILWLLPAFLMWASFPPMGEKTDILFALAPLMWLTRRGTAKGNFKIWFLNGFLFWVLTLSWMPAIVKNGGPLPLVILGWGVLSAYCALFFGAYGYFAQCAWSWAKEGSYARRLLMILLVEPILWCGLELVRSRFMGGFSWNQLGVPIANMGFGAPAAIGGVYMVSAIVIMINGLIAGQVERFWKVEESNFKGLRKFGAIETIIPVVIIYALYVWADSELVFKPGVEKEELKVAMVQRNFPCVFNADSSKDDPRTVYEDLLKYPAYLKPDLVILPESALCEFGEIHTARAKNFASGILSKTGAKGVIAGGLSVMGAKEYNSAALYAADGSLQVYDKVHLVPFGEFIPGDKIFPVLQRFAPVGSCTPGEKKLLSLACRDIDLGVAICYEDTDSALIRSLTEMGAQALVFITNDSWFSGSVETEQHAWQALVRAIETARPIVRVGNSGVTGTIDEHGRASWIVGLDGKVLVDARTSASDKISFLSAAEAKKHLTFYVRYGDKPLMILFACLLFAMCAIRISKNWGIAKHGEFLV
jgi:apolipoprotein N-acyltransferase